MISSIKKKVKKRKFNLKRMDKKGMNLMKNNRQKKNKILKNRKFKMILRMTTKLKNKHLIIKRSNIKNNKWLSNKAKIISLKNKSKSQ